MSRAVKKRNIFGFGRKATSPRNTTPARGGIAKHSLGPHQSGLRQMQAKSGAVGSYKGYALYQTPEGEFYSSLEPSSWFGTKQAAKKHVDYMMELRRSNPSLFDKCVTSVSKRGGAADPRAVCATAGREKYGQAEMTRRAVVGKRRAAKRNPAEAAVEVYEEFHGRKPDEVVTVKRDVHFHKHLAGIGVLKRLQVKGVDGQVHNITGFKGALLCTNEEKNQLFIEGGDQSINLEDFGIKKPHEIEKLGKVLDIDYFTRKDHLGDEGGEAVYTHQFRTTNKNGEHIVVDWARYPDLIYRVRDEQLEFSGGSYVIRAEGIDR